MSIYTVRFNREIFVLVPIIFGLLGLLLVLKTNLASLCHQLQKSWRSILLSLSVHSSF